MFTCLKNEKKYSNNISIRKGELRSKQATTKYSIKNSGLTKQATTTLI